MLGSFLFTIGAFLVAITLLIAIHEFGHFWVAKSLGVKVLRYSIGFGKPLWRRIAGADRTEYVVAALPLGGYVKMLDEREGEVAAAELPRAFNRQPVAKRFAIVLAGPVFNFLLAIVLYWLMLVVGVTSVRPVINDVTPDSPKPVCTAARRSWRSTGSPRRSGMWRSKPWCPVSSTAAAPRSACVTATVRRTTLRCP